MSELGSLVRELSELRCLPWQGHYGIALTAAQQATAMPRLGTHLL